MLIALLEDDDSTADLIKAYLTGAGNQVVRYASGRTFREGAARRTPDLAIVDRMLPDDDGVEVVKWFRAAVDAQAPVLFASALGEESDIVAALDAAVWAPLRTSREVLPAPTPRGCQAPRGVRHPAGHRTGLDKL